MDPLSASGGATDAAQLIMLRRSMDVAQSSMTTLLSAMPEPVRSEAGLAPLSSHAALDVRV